MMLPIHWTAQALDELDAIIGYVAESNPSAAEELHSCIVSAVVPLANYPYMYRTSRRVPGLREFVAHPNYAVLYRVTAMRIEIVNVVHVRRNYPS